MMNVRSRYGIMAAAVILLFPLAAFGAERSSGGDWRGNWQSIQTAIDHVRSVKASFVQEKHMKILIRPLSSEGVFFFQKPASLRWEYKKPVRSVLLFHNAKTRYFITGSKGLIEVDGSGAQAMQFGVQEITRWLSGRFDENPAFDMKLVPGEKIVLTAKDPSIGRFVRKIEIHLSDRPGGVESAWIYESQDSYTRLIFEDSVFNENLAPSLFSDVN